MIVVVIRLLVVGLFAFLWAFNRWCMVLPDDREKLRRGVPILAACVLVPLALGTLGPARAVGALSWVLIVGVVAAETWRVAFRQISLFSARSRAEDVEGFRGRVLTTEALQVRHYHFEDCPPALAGLRVAFVSDLHMDGTPPVQWYDKFWKEVERVAPDLLLLGGDYVSHRESLPLARRCLEGLASVRPPLGVWGVFGNHDAEDLDGVGFELERVGCRVLRGECVEIETPRGPLRLAGSNAPWIPAEGPAGACLPPEGADIALTHTPENALDLAAAGARFILAGHLHAGQIAAPVLGALIVPSRHSRRWTYGCYPLRRGHLVVTSGVGSVGIPVRLFAHPEIALLRFGPDAAASDEGTTAFFKAVRSPRSEPAAPAPPED